FAFDLRHFPILGSAMSGKPALRSRLEFAFALGEPTFMKAQVAGGLSEIAAFFGEADGVAFAFLSVHSSLLHRRLLFWGRYSPQPTCLTAGTFFLGRPTLLTDVQEFP